MAEEQAQPSGPDLAQGVATSDFTGETLLGHVGDQEVLLVRTKSGIFAIDAHCSHYHGPLAEGLVVGHSVRCPWHHACFDLRTGEAARAPALSPLAVWNVEQQGSRIFVREKREQPQPIVKGPVAAPDKIVIVGGGAAGFAAAEMLRRQKFGGDIVMLSNDARGARRSAESVEGLSGRQCAGGLAAVASGRLLYWSRHRSSAQDARSPRSIPKRDRLRSRMEDRSL